jgi:HEAT repeat protein
MGPAAKEAIPALATRLNDPNPELRREAALAMGAMGEAASGAIPQLSDLLADDHAAVAATYALGRIGNLPADVDAAVAANAKSEDAMLSTTSLWVLAHNHPEDKELRADVTEQLIGRLSDDDSYVRVAAARGLAALPPAPEITLPIWKKALEGVDETTMAHALDALARLGAPAVPAMAKALQYEALRPHVVKVLQELGPDAAGASSALAELVNDPDEATAHEATQTLARIGPGAKAAVPVLVEALKQNGHPNAHAIVYALGAIGPAAGDAEDELMALVGGSNQDMALVSAWSLTKISPSPAVASKVVPVFIAGLASPKPATRRGAAESLGQMGKNGKAADSALERAQKDSDKSVRDAATRALALVRG